MNRAGPDRCRVRLAGLRVLIVAHQVIVNCFRYLLEHLDGERGAGHGRGRRARGTQAMSAAFVRAP